jgi:hypothetical protein
MPHDPSVTQTFAQTFELFSQISCLLKMSDNNSIFFVAPFWLSALALFGVLLCSIALHLYTRPPTNLKYSNEPLPMYQVYAELPPIYEGSCSHTNPPGYNDSNDIIVVLSS